MSKSPLFISAFLIASLIFVPVAFAQSTDDSDGFAPAQGSGQSAAPTSVKTTPPATDQMQIVPTNTSAPVANGTNNQVDTSQQTSTTVDQKLEILKNSEQAKFQSSQDKYNGILTSQTNPSQNAGTNYKLSTLLISARYHKTLELLTIYLQNISQSINDYNANSGFKLNGSDTAINNTEQELENLSNMINDFDTKVDTFSESTDTSSSENGIAIQSQSTSINSELETGKQNLLDLVNMIQ